jgi:hypothetical protein
MTIGMKDIMAMVGRSLKSPREGAHEVLTIRIPQEAVGMIVVLVVVLSVLLAQVMGLMILPADTDMVIGLFSSAIVAGLVQLVVMLVTIGGVFWIGRAMGGTGSLKESALIISWLQFIMVCLQLVQLVVLVILPPFAGLIGIVALGVFLWLLTNFVATLHGFKSLGQVFVMIIVSTFTLAFLISLLFALFGVDLPMPETGA